MYSHFSPIESFDTGTDLSSAFQSNFTATRNGLTSRLDGLYKEPVPTYEELLKNALNPVKAVNIEPILLDTDKALARFLELKTSLKTQLELQAKQNEALALFEKQLKSFSESSQFLTNTMNTLDDFEEDKEKWNEKVQEFSTYMDTHTSKMSNKLQVNINQTNNTIINIKDNLKSFASLLSQNIKYMLTSEELKEIESGRQCPICITNTVNRVFDTCGHTLCSECEPSIRDATCHICRSSNQRINKLFF